MFVGSQVLAANYQRVNRHLKYVYIVINCILILFIYMINIRFKYFMSSIIIVNNACMSDISGYRKEPRDIKDT